MKNKLILVLILAFVVLLTNCEEDDQNNLKGVNFTLFSEPGMQSSITLSNTNIVNYDEILGYDSTLHVFLLNDKAKERILNYSTSSFAVAVDGTVVYMASFIPGYSSISCFECIRIEPFSADNKYAVELGYPGGDGFTGVDNRNDERIIEVLKRDNKLISIDIK